MATSVLTKDPLFGWVTYGAKLNKTKKGYAIFPKDGIRSRFAIVTNDMRIHLKLDSDGFAKDYPITVSPELDEVSFVIENRSDNPHQTKLYIENYDHHTLNAFLDGKAVTVEKNKEVYYIEIPMNKDLHTFLLTIKH